MKYFPILLLLLVIVSCQKDSDKPPLDTLNYSQLLDKANIKIQNNELDSGFYFLNQAKLTCKSEEGDKIIYALVIMADIQKKQSDFYGMEETSTEAFQHFENCKDSIYIYSIYNALAIAYLENFDYKNALKYYQLCKNDKLSAKDKAVLENNSAVVHLKKEQYKEAIHILEQIIKNCSIDADLTNKARVYDNLGYAYFKLDPTKGLNFLELALSINENFEEDYQKTPVLLHLSEFYLKSDKTKAHYYANRAYQTTLGSKNIDDQIEALDWLIKTSSPEHFHTYFDRYVYLTDSIKKVRQNAKNQFAKIKYDATKANQEIVKHKNEKQIQVTFFSVASVFGLLLFLLFRVKTKKKQQYAVYDTEQRIAKRIHDELANDVHHAMTFMETQDFQEKETLIGRLEKIYNTTRNIAKENSAIATGKEFEKELHEMISSYNSSDVNVVINKTQKINWDKIASEKKIVVYRVLLELLVNMKKHSQSTLVVLGFEQKATTIEINYADNGIGFSKMLNYSNGIQNAENRIKAIKGTITFDSATNKGCKVKIVLPK